MNMKHVKHYLLLIIKEYNGLSFSDMSLLEKHAGTRQASGTAEGKLSTQAVSLLFNGCSSRVHENEKARGTKVV